MRCRIRWLSGLFLVSGLCTIFAQETIDIDISGTVTDMGGSPVEGASVSLSTFDLSTLTDAAGQYLLQGQIVGVSGGLQRPFAAKRPAVRGDGIYFAITKKNQPVAIDLFSLQGRKIHEILNTRLDKGSYRINPLSAAHASQVYILRVLIGERSTLLRFAAADKSGSGSPALQKLGDDAPLPALEKGTQTPDTLAASAEGYIPELRPIESYTGTQDFTLMAQGPVSGSFDILYSINNIEDPIPSYLTAVWLEDADSNYLRTFLVCEWLSVEGYDWEMAICPTWRAKVDWAVSPQEEFDAATTATIDMASVGDHEFTFNLDFLDLDPGVYRFCVETHLESDYNYLYRTEIYIGGEASTSQGELSYVPENLPDIFTWLDTTAISDVSVRYQK